MKQVKILSKRALNAGGILVYMAALLSFRQFIAQNGTLKKVSQDADFFQKIKKSDFVNHVNGNVKGQKGGVFFPISILQSQKTFNQAMVFAVGVAESYVVPFEIFFRLVYDLEVTQDFLLDVYNATLFSGNSEEVQASSSPFIHKPQTKEIDSHKPELNAVCVPPVDSDALYNAILAENPDGFISAYVLFGGQGGRSAMVRFTDQLNLSPSCSPKDFPGKMPRCVIDWYQTMVKEIQLHLVRPGNAVGKHPSSLGLLGITVPTGAANWDPKVNDVIHLDYDRSALLTVVESLPDAQKALKVYYPVVFNYESFMQHFVMCLVQAFDSSPERRIQSFRDTTLVSWTHDGELVVTEATNEFYDYAKSQNKTVPVKRSVSGAKEARTKKRTRPVKEVSVDEEELPSGIDEEDSNQEERNGGSGDSKGGVKPESASAGPKSSPKNQSGGQRNAKKTTKPTTAKPEQAPRKKKALTKAQTDALKLELQELQKASEKAEAKHAAEIEELRRQVAEANASNASVEPATSEAPADEPNGSSSSSKSGKRRATASSSEQGASGTLTNSLERKAKTQANAKISSQGASEVANEADTKNGNE